MPQSQPLMDSSDDQDTPHSHSVGVHSEPPVALPRFGPEHNVRLTPPLPDSRFASTHDANPPLPPLGEPEGDSGADSEASVSIAPERWVANDDPWQTSSHMVVYGRPVARPTRPISHPLPRPQRFRRVPRWRSYLFLGIVLVAMVMTVAGAIEIGQLSKDVFGKPGSGATPTTSQTTPAHTTPGATPKK